MEGWASRHEAKHGVNITGSRRAVPERHETTDRLLIRGHWNSSNDVRRLGAHCTAVIRSRAGDSPRCDQRAIQSDFALNSVAVFTIGLENVALQQVPSEVLNCAMTLGAPCNGNGPKDGLLIAFTCTFPRSGIVPALSVTLMIPSGMPVVLLNLQPVGLPVHAPPP